MYFSVDESSNLKGSGAGIVLEGPRDVTLEQSLCFNFQASNNQTEYKAVIVGLKFAKIVEVTHISVRTDPQLIGSQITRNYKMKDPTLLKYLQRTLQLVKGFTKVDVSYIP